MGLARDHGDLAFVRLGPFDVYAANHPDHVKDVLVTNHRRFMKGQGLQEAKRLLGEGLLTSEGEVHRRQRRLIQPIFHHERTHAYGSAMVEASARTRDRWRDGPVDMNREMMRLTLTIVGRTLFDADVEGEAAHVGDALTTAMELFDTLTIPFGGLLDRLPLPRTKRFKAAREELFGVIDRMIAEHRARGSERGDLLSMLLAAQDEDGGAMSDQQVRDEAMTIFLAGHETTAQWLTWTWYLLSRNPAAEARLHDELDEVLGDRLPVTQDVERLPYTGMLLSEALRLYPPAYVVGRRALEDHRMGGYLVPAGSLVLLSPWVSHHDPRWFPEPFRFEPGRWVEPERSKRPRHSFFPFGAGPRVCIGEGFAWMEATLALATLASAWRARLDPSHEVEIQPVITLRPKGGMPMTLERRRR